MAVTKDTPCTMHVTVGISDGEQKSEITLKLPAFRAEYARGAFEVVKLKLAEAGRDIAVFDVEVLGQVSEVVVTPLN